MKCLYLILEVEGSRLKPVQFFRVNWYAHVIPFADVKSDHLPAFNHKALWD